MNKNTTNYIKQRWEKEANVVISEDMWLEKNPHNSLPLILSFGEISVGKT